MKLFSLLPNRLVHFACNSPALISGTIDPQPIHLSAIGGIGKIKCKRVPFRRGFEDSRLQHTRARTDIVEIGLGGSGSRSISRHARGSAPNRGDSRICPPRWRKNRLLKSLRRKGRPCPNQSRQPETNPNHPYFT